MGPDFSQEVHPLLSNIIRIGRVFVKSMLCDHTLSTSFSRMALDVLAVASEGSSSSST